MRLSRGEGWSGQTSWWYAEETTNREARKFVGEVVAVINGQPVHAVQPSRDGRRGVRNGSSDPAGAIEDYSRYERAVRSTGGNLAFARNPLPCAAFLRV